MLPSIPASDFVNPYEGSREWKALQRAIDLAPTTNVELIGEIRGERYYRVRAKGRDRHCVIIWFSQLSQRTETKCDCEAHIVPQTPQPCFHIAAALIEDSKPQKAGRKETNGRRPTQREQDPAPADDRITAAR